MTLMVLGCGISIVKGFNLSGYHSTSFRKARSRFVDKLDTVRDVDVTSFMAIRLVLGSNHPCPDRGA